MVRFSQQYCLGSQLPRTKSLPQKDNQKDVVVQQSWTILGNVQRPQDKDLIDHFVGFLNCCKLV